MFYIFNKEGKCICTCDFEPNKEDLVTRGETVLESEQIYDIALIKIVNGKLQEVILPEPTMKDLRSIYQEKFKAIRDEEEAKPLQFKNALLDFDSLSRERLMFAILAQEKTMWTTADGKIIELKVEDLQELPGIIKVRTSVIYNRYNEIKTQIKRATTKEELEKITWA